MLVADLLGAIERLAPAHLALEWDNSGLSVGDVSGPARQVLVSLELTEAVLAEALSKGCDTILTHHPLFFQPVRSLVESKPRERLLRSLVRNDVALVACHTNVDSAGGGLADIAGAALGLSSMEPLEPASAGWTKLVGFIPSEAVESVAQAVFGAGAGGVGRYSDCAFATEGRGWFTPGAGSRPHVGEVDRPERVVETRWETVVPRARVGAAVRAFVAAHPYEEPAFDLYPVEDVLPGVGVGRIGTLAQKCKVADLAKTAAGLFEASGVTWSGDGEAVVERVAVLPGSGRGSIEKAAGRCEALITGDLSHHDAEQAAEAGLALVDVPHGDIEWWAFRRWIAELQKELEGQDVRFVISEAWSASWNVVR